MRKSKSYSGWTIAIGVVILLAVVVFIVWPHLINSMLPADSRPGKITFAADPVSDSEFEQIALDVRHGAPDVDFFHIDIFRNAGIRSYEGPKTCLTCHETVQLGDAHTGKTKYVDLMENLLTSSHYRFFTEKRDNVYGFNGELADNFPMGKIDRPCPKPGSFAFTAWAELVVTERGDTLSEGCGQCHIGGQYQAPFGELMPGYRTLEAEKEAIDCLICHSAGYDMNRKVVQEDGARLRWGQDRSMKAAMTAVRPTSQNCLRCHQHNMGGDLYIDETDPSFMQSMLNTGYEHPRVKHPGSKRGTPFSPSWDVHAAAGVNCIDCHVTEGHYIAKGLHTTTMMSNDLPDVEVKCEKCHSAQPHIQNEEIADFLNMHTEKVACVTCHIPSLQEDNATRRDFSESEWEENPGIYVYTDHEKKTQGPDAIMFRWWTGDGTFLGNAIGDNPNGQNLYRFYKPEHVWPEYKDYDYAGWYEKVMRPIAQKKPSKLYAMKVFNGKQHIDLSNITPFGGMYVPYNLPSYYRYGDPQKAGQVEEQKSMMGMMYGWMFKVYLMDKFMGFMDADGWHIDKYTDLMEGKGMEARWIPQDASMEISHAIRKEGLQCSACHSKDGVFSWTELGYSEDDAEMYEENPL